MIQPSIKPQSSNEDDSESESITEWERALKKNI